MMERLVELLYISLCAVKKKYNQVGESLVRALFLVPVPVPGGLRVHREVPPPRSGGGGQHHP